MENFDIYKEFANNSLERFLLFLNDAIECLEEESCAYNDGLKEFIKVYANICYKQQSKNDNSMNKAILKTVKVLCNQQENLILICKALYNVLETFEDHII